MESLLNFFVKYPTVYSFLVLLLFLFLQGIVTWYFAYWKRRGEDKAIKDSIADIKRIENRLSILLQNEVSLKGEERKAIFEYNRTLHEVMNYLVESMFYIHNSAPKEIIDRLFEKVFKLVQSEGHLLLMVNESELNEKIKVIRDPILAIVSKIATTSSELRAIQNRHSEDYKKIWEGFTQNLRTDLTSLESKVNEIRVTLRARLLSHTVDAI